MNSSSFWEDNEEEWYLFIQLLVLLEGDHGRDLLLLLPFDLLLHAERVVGVEDFALLLNDCSIVVNHCYKLIYIDGPDKEEDGKRAEAGSGSTAVDPVQGGHK